jgi:hypothetical protein
MGASRETSADPLLATLLERRLALRLPAATTVTLWDFPRRRRGELIDLSLTGARVRFAEPVTADRRPWLWLPAGLGGSRAHPIGSEVMWSDALLGRPTGHCEVGLRFLRFPLGGRTRIARALADLVGRAEQASERPAPEERRRAERVAYPRRVIARGAGSPLVLLGRDLSSGGMSVETRRALAVGDHLQLALHAGGSVPLVVHAEVLRAIDETVWALAFRNPAPTQRDRLEAIVRDQAGPHSDARLLVTEAE